MTYQSLLEYLQSLPFAVAILEGESWFPLFESLHVLAITLVVGTIGIVDLRLLGWASLDRSVGRVSDSVLPVTWCAFALAVATGALLFCSNATVYGHNTFFIIKFVFIGLAGLNMLVFQLFTRRDLQIWGDAAHPPAAARAAGALSLLFWVAVVLCGRWVGFTLKTPGLGG